MIHLYTWATPNGRKASIMLEEIGVPYELHPVNLRSGEQFKPEFLAINPNNKIPAIVDSEGPGGQSLTLFESGAILIYLAEKTHKLLPAMQSRERYEVIQWLMFQMGGVGPMFGQANYFCRMTDKIPYAIERFRKEALRLYGVLDGRLAGQQFLAGDYSIADIATYPWVARHEGHQVKLEDYPNIKRWFDLISARPAVQKGMAIPKV